MEEVTKTKGVEIARLTAQLRKAEMMVTSLERQVDQKVGGTFDAIGSLFFIICRI